MCTSGYVECGPVKEVKPLKARTKRERMFLSMREKLPELTVAQKRWIHNNVFEKYGLYWKEGTVRCMCCGHYEHVDKPLLAVSLGGGSHTCPNCGENLPLRFWKDSGIQKFGGHEELRDVSFVTTFKGYTVVRTFQIRRWNGCGSPTKIFINEVYQNWVDDEGRETILSKTYTRSPWHFRWNHLTDLWGVKHHNGGCSGYYIRNDVFDVTGNIFYPVTRVSKRLKRNGWRSELVKFGERTNIVEVMKKMLTEPFAEELVKTKQYSLLAFWMNEGGRLKDRTRWLHALRICNRNGYIIPDASIWTDYLELLEYFHKDTHNAMYVCPENLLAAHDRLMNKKEAKENARKLAERMAQAEKYEAQYKKGRGRFFGICFGDENIMITVIGSVKEIAEEGTFMHHCVFANGYYDMKRHPDSLILSAKDKDGNRLETIEINIRTWKVVQSRGRMNQSTAQHADILKLLDKNMFLLRRAA